MRNKRNGDDASHHLRFIYFRPRHIPVGVVQSPPLHVHRSSSGSICPTSYILCIVSSNGIIGSNPRSTIFADVIALDTAATFLLMHGISVNPPTGSQTNPNMFCNARDAARNPYSTVPPNISITAAAAIALAEPFSAWHPATSAPNVASLAINAPTNPAASNPFSITASSN